jgi:hypothetical protein
MAQLLKYAVLALLVVSSIMWTAENTLFYESCIGPRDKSLCRANLIL